MLRMFHNLHLLGSIMDRAQNQILPLRYIPG
jgi:hypothetical protein